MDIERFKQDRKEALLKGGETFIAYCKKYGITMPDNPEVVERARLKAITGATDIPMAERSKAKAELKKRNSSSFDDGDVP